MPGGYLPDPRQTANPNAWDAVQRPCGLDSAIARQLQQWQTQVTVAFALEKPRDHFHRALETNMMPFFV